MVVKHEMGHLPFEAEITNFVKYGEENRITVLCDNALIQTTVPQGKITEVAKLVVRKKNVLLSYVHIVTANINEFIF